MLLMLLYQLTFTHIGAIFIIMLLSLLNNFVITESKEERRKKMIKNYFYYMMLFNICYVFDVNIRIQLAIILFDLYFNLPCFWWRVN